MMGTRYRCRKSKAVGSRKKKPPVEPLDKKDEVWCYVLIKLFTAMLEDPEEAKKMLKPTTSAFDVDLEPAVRQLKKAIERKKSEHSSTRTTCKKTASKVSSFTTETKNYNVTPTSSRPTSSESSSSNSEVNSVDLKNVIKILSKVEETKSNRTKDSSKTISRTMSTTNNPGARGDRNSLLANIINLLNVYRG
uniref:Uncharacterized protein n=1 Tax=Lygus hesperus TaxID=30085 RepID=A0A0A9YBU4_LYGHE